jgi:hypothetical protein
MRKKCVNAFLSIGERIVDKKYFEKFRRRKRECKEKEKEEKKN